MSVVEQRREARCIDHGVLDPERGRCLSQSFIGPQIGAGGKNEKLHRVMVPHGRVTRRTPFSHGYTWGMIEGSLDRLHFGDLLQWLQMGEVSGRLTLKDSRGERRFDFIDGRVCFASSSHPDERLATWLARREVLPVAQLRKILATSMVRRGLFTDLLLTEGNAAPEDVRMSLTDLAESLTGRILALQQVRFCFEPEYPVLDILGLSINVEPSQLLMEGARRSDEDDTPETPDESYELDVVGEAFENLFWVVVRDGISGEEFLNGEQMSDLHNLVRDIVSTLTQWLASSPGLVPLPSGQIDELADCHARRKPISLFGLPHVAWNQMVLACSLRHQGWQGPMTLGQLEEIAGELDLWREMVDSEMFHRPDAGKLDEVIGHVVTTWSRAAAAAAPHLGLDPETASLAVHMVTVPTDLVLWVLSTLPVPLQGLRKALLGHLSRRVGSRLAYLVGFPVEIREILDLRAPTPLGTCLHFGRECLASAATWLPTVPDAGEALLDIASPEVLAAAANAARKAVQDTDSKTVAPG